ncbi:MAG: ABC transporter permease [Anaerolineae bacterium]
MATTSPNPQSEKTGIANLHDDHLPLSKSLWRDSFERLIRNRLAMIGMIVIILNILMAVFASSIAPHSYSKQNLLQTNAAPQWVIDLFPTMRAQGTEGGYVRVVDAEEFPLGTDPLGRDLLSRIIYGARVSLAVAFVGPLFATAIGLTLGLIAGYFGGRIDDLIMRIVDTLYAFPTLLVIILMMAYFRSGAFAAAEAQGTLGGFLYQADRSIGGMLFIFIGIGITSWLGLARLTRGQVLSVRENEYILAARAQGASRLQIITKHVLPNIMGPLIVAETLTIPGYISSEAFLSFIGLGVSPPTPSWGQMISDGSQYISSYPHEAIFPALALFFVMFAFNFLGDGLRDAFDPRLRGVD